MFIRDSYWWERDQEATTQETYKMFGSICHLSQQGMCIHTHIHTLTAGVCIQMKNANSLAAARRSRAPGRARMPVQWTGGAGGRQMENQMEKLLKLGLNSGPWVLSPGHNHYTTHTHIHTLTVGVCIHTHIHTLTAYIHTYTLSVDTEGRGR